MQKQIINETQKELFGDNFPIQDTDCEACKLIVDEPMKMSDIFHQIRDKYDPSKQNKNMTFINVE